MLGKNQSFLPKRPLALFISLPKSLTASPPSALPASLAAAPKTLNFSLVSSFNKVEDFSLIVPQASFAASPASERRSLATSFASASFSLASVTVFSQFSAYSPRLLVFFYKGTFCYSPCSSPRRACCLPSQSRPRCPDILLQIERTHFLYHRC